MNRRELFKRVASAATAVAAPIAAPIAAFSQQHVHEFPDFSQLSSPPESPDWKPEFFTPQENATTIAVTELIIPQTDTPGAKAAFVNRHMDKLLLVEPPASQERFRAGLRTLDQSRPFVELSSMEQTRLLEAMEAAKDPFFSYIKGFTARIYYATKPGFLELNKGGRVPDTFGCTDAAHKR